MDENQYKEFLELKDEVKLIRKFLLGSTLEDGQGSSPGFVQLQAQNQARMMEDLYGREDNRKNCIEARLSRGEEDISALKEARKHAKWFAAGWLSFGGLVSGIAVWWAEHKPTLPK